MRLTFRAKLLAIAGTSAVAFLLLIAVSALIARRSTEQVTSIRDRYLPRVELSGQLESRFDQLRRTLQDAVAARDPEGLARADELKESFLGQLDAARAAIDPADAAALRAVFEDYYGRAYDVSRRLIAHETGEAVVASMALMQARQARSLELLRKAAAFDRGALAQAFSAIEQAQVTAGRVQLAVVVACLMLVISLSLWLSGGLIRSLAQLAAGLERFGRGEFERPIDTGAADELGELATRANEMAGNLHRLATERERADWIKQGTAALAEALRGDLEPPEVAARALRVLATHLEAPAGVCYALDGDTLRPIASYAADDEGATAPTFQRGQGLVGQAIERDELLVLRDPPEGHLQLRSGLGSSSPRAIVVVPLWRADAAEGALELALLRPWSDRAAELLHAVRETVVLALRSALVRVRTRDLLTETQALARRLTTQEEELRATNEELQTQQEELRKNNDELSAQAEELAAQQRTLEQRNLELDDARRGLEKKAAELSSVSAYKSQFLTNMSHELRTPLNSMLLLSNLLAENGGAHLTPKQVEFARTIHSSGKDLLALINQVLDLAKVEAGKQEIHVDDVPLRPLLTHIERVFEPLAKDKGLSLRVAIDPSVPELLRTDRQRVEQILRNLLGNAIKFTDRGSVSLEVSTLGTVVVLEVRDTGIGIAPEHRDRVFAPFEQVDGAADRRHGGTGLGLAIARELAVLLGGDLLLRSQVGEGSTFTLTLPREGAPTEPRVRATVPPPAVASAARNESGAVLVIEDDPRFAEELCRLITAQGIAHLVAHDGRTGLRLAREQRPSGILLDVKLPDLDGWAVMAELRADPDTVAIPVHFVSAVEAGGRAMAMGAIGYLTKPASKEDLVRAIESVAPRGRQGSCSVLVVEDDATLGDSLVARLSSEHLEVERAATAHAALEAIARRRFDCLILDLALPDMDGLELLQRVDQESPSLRPAVVVYTARALTKAETRHLEAYAEAIVLKDGSSQERLVEEVRLFVRRLRDGLGPRRLHASGADGELKLAGTRVLVADDDMRTVYALSAALMAKGAEVLVADTGKAAVELLRDNPDVAVVLMDIMMPEMDGYEATRLIRQEARFAKLPIIALTAKAMKGDAEKCLAAGASDYMSKPVDARRLLELIHERVTKRA